MDPSDPVDIEKVRHDRMYKLEEVDENDLLIKLYYNTSREMLLKLASQCAAVVPLRKNQLMTAKYSNSTVTVYHDLHRNEL